MIQNVYLTTCGKAEWLASPNGMQETQLKSRWGSEVTELVNIYRVFVCEFDDDFIGMAASWLD